MDTGKEYAGGLTIRPDDDTAERRVIVNPSELTDMDVIGGLSSARVSANNFEGTPQELMLLELAATGPESVSGGDMVGSVIEVEYWYAHRVEIEDKNGELIQAPRVVLIQPNGSAIKFLSGGVFDTLRLIVKYAGRRRWKPALKFTIKEVKTRSGFKMLTLSPVISK